MVEPDEAAIERAVGGDRHVKLTPTERGIVIRRLSAQNKSISFISHLLGCSQQTVTRHRRTRDSHPA